MSSTPPRVIDVHCGWGATPAAPEWNAVTKIRAALQSRGIGHACLTPALSRRYDLVAGDDALGAALEEENESGVDVDLRGWLVIHPSRAAESNALMRRHLYSDNFVGAALYADPVTGEPVNLRDCTEVINSFRRYARPLLIETKSADAMVHAVQIAETLGGMKVIASGMGGDEWHEALPLAAHPLNLYLDISGTLVPEKILYAISVFHGTRKLLFASGAPQTDPAAVLGMLDDIDLTPDDRDRILYTNASRLMHIGAVADAPAALAPLSAAAPGPNTPQDVSELLAQLGQLQPPPDPAT